MTHPFPRRETVQNQDLYRYVGRTVDQMVERGELQPEQRDSAFGLVLVGEQRRRNLAPSLRYLELSRQPLHVDHPRLRLARRNIDEYETKAANEPGGAFGQDLAPERSDAGRREQSEKKTAPRLREGTGAGKRGPNGGGAVPVIGGLGILEGAGAVARVAAPVAVLAVIAECSYIAYQRAHGEIDEREAKSRFVVAGAGGVGGLLGAVLAGAAAGSVFPGPGTVVGGLVGGVGALFGSRSMARWLMT